MGQGLLAPHHGFSQLAASFFASWSLGIHRPPLLSFPLPSQALACGVLVFSFSSNCFCSMSMVSFPRPSGLVKPRTAVRASRIFLRMIDCGE